MFIGFEIVNLEVSDNLSSENWCVGTGIGLDGFVTFDEREELATFESSESELEHSLGSIEVFEVYPQLDDTC